MQVMDEHLIPALLNWASSHIKTKWWWVEANNWVDNNTLITTAVRRPARLETNTEQTKNTWGRETKYRTNQNYLEQRDKIQKKKQNPWGRETK